MKKFISKAIIATTLTALSITSCTNSPQQQADKVDQAQINLDLAKQDLKQARIDSVNDYQLYRIESEKRIKDNDLKIAALKASIKADNKANHDKYEKMLEDYDRKNAKLKISIEEYKQGASDQWVSFKKSFNQDLDDLGKAISGLSDKK